MTELTEEEKMIRDQHIKKMLKEDNDRALNVVCTGLAIASFILVIFSLF